MIDLFPFAGYPVAVLGLGPAGIATAKSLQLSEAEVIAWDDDEDNRARAEAEGVELRDLNKIDWREPVSLAIEHHIPHGKDDPHPLVAAARGVNCEVISDVELLARAQRDAKFGAVVSRAHGTELVDFLSTVLSVAGQEIEAADEAENPALGLYPLDLGGTYILEMPPSKADITVSITFDVAVFLDVGSDPWPPFKSVEDTVTAARWVFHRQTGPRGAVVNVDDPAGKAFYDRLKAANEQIVIPISGKSRCPSGVYVAGNDLYDDIAGNNDLVTSLPVPDGDGSAGLKLMSAAVYAAATVLDVPPHAAMAAVRGYLEEDE